MPPPQQRNQAPSPGKPLLLLILVLLLVFGPSWLFNQDAEADESEARTMRIEYLILIPAVILIGIQFYGAYEGGFRPRVPQVSLNDSLVALVGLGFVIAGLLWVRSNA